MQNFMKTGTPYRGQCWN